MAKQVVNLGSAANDGTGDPLRSAFDKINDNFQEIYDTLGGPNASALSDLFLQGSTLTNRTTNGNITIDPNGTGTIFLNGPVEFKGTTTQIDTTSLQVEDNLLEINRNSSGADVDAGIYMNRGGAGNNAVFYWNEGEDKFKAVLSTSNATATSVTDSSKATIVANIEGDSATITTVNTNTLNSSFYELDKGNYSEIYTIDSIFSGYANSEAYAYNESFFNEMASQEIIDDYNKKQLWEKHKSMFESQFTRYGQAGGYHGPTREYIRANLKDPLSYEELKIGYEFYDSESDVVEAFSLDGPALFVGVEYSAKNSFGGRVRGEFRAFWNPDGSLKLVIVDE